MIKNNEEESIKNLIKKGFDLELISFELDIPIEEVKKLKSEIETSQKFREIKTYSAREIIESRNKQAHLKMERMRKKYNRLFLKSNKTEVKLPRELSEQEIELINSAITKIEETIKGMKELSKKERRKEVRKILEELNKLEDYQLTIEQAERLYLLMQQEELKKLSLNSTDRIDVYINRNIKAISRKLTEAIDIIQSQTEDLEELKSLERKLTTRNRTR